MNRTIKSICIFILAVSLLFSLCGCASKSYSYSVVSNDVYLAGDYMRGPTPRAIDIEITLSDKTLKDGTSIEFDYFGTKYSGTIRNHTITWDKTPLLVSEGTVTKSKIETYNSGIKIVHNYKMDNYSLTGEIIQVFSQKK